MTEKDVLTFELLENLDGTYQGDNAVAIYEYITNNTYDTVKVSERVCNYTTPCDFLISYLCELCVALGYKDRLVARWMCDDDTKKLVREFFTCCRTTDNRMYVFAKFNTRNGKDIPERVKGVKARVRTKFIDELLKGLD